MKNGVKNGKNTQFSSINQPSGTLKSDGWKRKKYAQEFMDKVMVYQDMTIAEFEEIQNETEFNKSKYTVKDLVAIKYVSKCLKGDKFMIDWIDRHVGKAVNEKNDYLYSEPISKVQIEIIDTTEFN